MQGFEVIRSNSRYVMARASNWKAGYTPYVIYDTNSNSVIHQGQRKHIVEQWNTRYNYSRSRAFAAS